jgi:hypothetical protein
MKSPGAIGSKCAVGDMRRLIERPVLFRRTTTFDAPVHLLHQASEGISY